MNTVWFTGLVALIAAGWLAVLLAVTAGKVPKIEDDAGASSKSRVTDE